MLLTDLVLIGSLGNVTIPFVDLKLKLGRRWLLNWIWNKSKISDSKFRDLTPKQHRFGLDAAQFIFKSNVTHFLISVALFFQELAIQELFLASRQKSNLWLWSSRMVLDFYRYLTQEDTSSLTLRLFIYATTNLKGVTKRAASWHSDPNTRLIL